MADDIAASPSLPWSNSFSIGVEPLDADHRTLVQWINQICAYWRDGQRAQALQALDSLSALADEHFQREEALLRKLSGYREVEATAGEHGKRLYHLTALRRRFCKTDDADDLRRLCNEVIDWFVRQSVGHDAAIKAFFGDRGTRFDVRARRRRGKRSEEHT